MTRNTTIFDKDLNPVLEIASNDELEILVEYQKNKLSESLSKSEPYKLHSPNHSKYADLIAAELRDFGGNTFLNIFRKEGPSWYKITCDVAKKIKAPYKKGQDIETIENSILATILENAWENMTKDERSKLLKKLGISDKSMLKGTTAGAFQVIFRAGGFKSYQLTLIVANQVSRIILDRGLPLAANAAITRWASFLTGPIGLALTSIWTLIDVAGPAYKVIIPSVVHVALLRKKYNSIFCTNCEAELNGDDYKFCPQCGEKVTP